jgi:hypothetical protein
MVALVAGPGAVAAYAEAAERAAQSVGLDAASPQLALLLVLAAGAAVGGLAGAAAWRIAGRVQRRLRGLV